MQLHLTPQAANNLQTVLSRAVPRLRTEGPMAPMTEFLKEFQQRLTKGEREFDLTDKQARYLRRTVRAAKRFMEEQSAKPGTGNMMAAQLKMLQSMFEQVLGPEEAKTS